jgi:hypothetical protein
VGVGVCGGHSDRPPDQVDRGLGLPALVFQDAHKVQGIGVVRRHSQYGVVNLPGFVQAAVLVTRDREENSLLDSTRTGRSIDVAIRCLLDDAITQFWLLVPAQ